MKTELWTSTDFPGGKRILSLGTDIEEYSRIGKHLPSGEPDQLILDVFTPAEIQLNLRYCQPVQAFTAGFACKEAVFKALGKGWMNSGPHWQDVELLFDPAERPDGIKMRYSPDVSRMMASAGGRHLEGKLSFSERYLNFDAFITD